MSIVKDFYSTTVGKKIVMALTGLVLVSFVLGHMLGNLKMFAGVDPQAGRYKMDLYAEMLRSIGAGFMGHETFLWIVRAGLLACVFFHVRAAIQLSALNKKAKPIQPQRQWFGSSNAASRTMLYGGLFILTFIIFHILHFTTGNVHFNGFEHGAVYSNVYLGFKNMLTVGFYVIAMGFLSLHLYHGTWSVFQTLGIDTPAWNKGLRTIAKIVSILIFFGFTSVPLAIGFNLLPAPNQAITHHLEQK